MKIETGILDLHGSVSAVVITRQRLLAALRSALERRPVLLLTGPRQCGKTTVAREVLDAAAPACFDLEDPRSRTVFEEPMTALEPPTGLVVIDEV